MLKELHLRSKILKIFNDLKNGQKEEKSHQ